MNTSARWIVTVLACVLVIAGLAVYKYVQIQAAIAYGKSFPETSESVEAVTASVSNFQHEVTAIGEIIAPQSLELRNEEEGVIADIRFQPGDLVKKGTLLVQMDVREETARLKAAQARVNLAKLDVERVRRLIKQKNVSEEAVDQAEANFAIAEADVMALEASIARKSLRAPFDAQVGLHHFDPGEFLQSNTPIVSLVGINDYVWVDFYLPQSQMDVSTGTTVKVLLPGAGHKTLLATIIARDTMASETSRNLKLRARIDQAVMVPPNTLVKVRVPAGESEQVILPRTAISSDSSGDYVYVLLPDTSDNGDTRDTQGKNYRAHRRAVTVGFKDDQRVVIEKGLKSGELIAAKGAFKLTPNMLTFVRQRPSQEQADINRQRATVEALP